MKRLLYLDCLRVLSAFAVILLHVASSGWGSFMVNTVPWQLSNLFDGLVRWCVPMFVMISGALFLDPKRSLSIRDVYMKYCVRIVIIIGLWEVAAFGILLSKNVYRHGKLLDSIVKTLQTIEYPPGVSWFLFMLLGLYAIAPVLKFIAHDKNTLLYCMFCSFGLNAVSAFSNLIPHGEWMSKQVSLLELYRYQGFIGYFCAGAFFNTHFNDKTKRVILYWLGGFGALITVVGTSGLSFYYQRPVHNFYDFLSPNVAFMTFALFCFFKSFDMRSLSARNEILIVGISRATLLIYILHCYVIDVLRFLGLSVLAVGVGTIPVITSVTFVVSLLLAKILLKNGWMRKLFG